MFNPNDPRDLQMALRYEHSLIDEAKANPSIAIGCPVRVYSSADPYLLLGEGLVTKMTWDEYFYQYIVDVKTDEGMHVVLAGCCDRFTRNPALLRSRMRLIKGGRA